MEVSMRWWIVTALCWSTFCAAQDLLLPFGQQVGDDVLFKNDDGSSEELQLSTHFPYFGQPHDTLYVNTNGVISFLVSVRQYTPDAFPLGDQRRLIAPFWADVDTRVTGDIFWREITSLSILNSISVDIRLNFAQYSQFIAHWGFVVTWDRVGRFGGSPEDPVNTFQAVLVTNGRHSFVIFNYREINWMFGTASNSVPAQVGFNAGDGERYFSVPGSRTTSIMNVVTSTNVNQPGRWMFRVEEVEIVDGGCNTQGFLVLTPRYGSFLGGRKISVSGPCFEGTTIKCDFNGTIVQGEAVSPTMAECIAPPTFHLGKRSFRLSMDSGVTFRHTGNFWFVEDEDDDFSVRQVDPGAWNNKDLNTDLYIEWKNESFSSNTVSIDFVIIRDNSEGGIETVEVPLAPSVVNVGRFQLPKNLQHAINPELGENGGIRVREITEASQSAQSMWSPVGPSVWYINRYLNTVAQNGPSSVPSEIWQTITKYVDTTTDNLLEKFSIHSILHDLFDGHCERWYDEELKNPPDYTDVLPPPCTLDQAMNDPRFIADSACNMGKGCGFHKGAFHCVRSLNPSPSNAGQQACYDEEGRLLPFENGGGTYDRAHPGNGLGIGNWKNIFKHIEADVLPYFYCCTLSLGNCDKYGKLRPSQDCEDYVPPDIGGGRGDPHITTVDGNRYTFNGAGEFWIVKSPKLHMQGRTEKITGGTSSGSVWTALAMRSFSAVQGQSDVVQVQIQRQPVQGMQVLAGEEIVTFNQRHSWQYTGVLISAAENMGLVSIQFNEGANINITQAGGALYFTITLDDDYKGHTQGLLGVYNGDPDDDLQTPDGTIINTTSSLQVIHYNFGLRWRITESESLFSYPEGMTYAVFQDESFVPTFNVNYNDPQAVTLCSGDKQCIYDYLVTRNMDIALQTKESQEQYEMIASALQQVVTCGFPPLPLNGSANSTNGPVGVLVKFECNPGFTLSGSQYTVCQGDGTWSRQTPQCLGSCSAPISRFVVVTPGEPPFQRMKWYTFKCAPGFTGNSFSTQCTADMIWVPPFLESQCRIFEKGGSIRMAPGLYLHLFLTLMFLCAMR